jgi:hypothetical protein
MSRPGQPLKADNSARLFSLDFLFRRGLPLRRMVIEGLYKGQLRFILAVRLPA